MTITTTPNLQNKKISKYLGIVTGETILGAHFGKDFMAGLTNFFGGRSSEYEKSLEEARETALREMQENAQKLGANAVVGVDIDYEVLGQSGNMLMVSASGTAVVVE